MAFWDRFARQADVEKHDEAGIDSDDRLRELLATGLGQLSGEERALLQWKYTDGRSVREIAADLGTTEKAVESRLSRARLTLKESILKGLKHETRA